MISKKEILEKYKQYFENIIGYDINDGWNFLIENIILYAKNENIPFDFLQIKEKFGLLRVYINIKPNDIEDDVKLYDIVSFSACISKNICEKCGCFKDDVIDTGSWIHSFCENCFKKEVSND